MSDDTLAIILIISFATICVWLGYVIGVQRGARAVRRSLTRFRENALADHTPAPLPSDASHALRVLSDYEDAIYREVRASIRIPINEHDYVTRMTQLHADVTRLRTAVLDLAESGDVARRRVE
ncbi:hypothetical protein [Nocardioides sp.]|uniref:hypothetical protein n=1 Tax=Nocardioides sp. TaxID=35761 RepID=UPI0039E3EEFE